MGQEEKARPEPPSGEAAPGRQNRADPRATAKQNRSLPRTEGEGWRRCTGSGTAGSGLCPPLRTGNSSPPHSRRLWKEPEPSSPGTEAAQHHRAWPGQGWCSALCPATAPAHCKGTDGDASGQQEEAPSGLSIPLAAPPAPRTPTRHPSTAVGRTWGSAAGAVKR